ncbi:Protein-tyrosine phosphatase [Dictyocaulus viviparus]|uniref:Protein-tyrosine phosphatase n=1 Tax=Dictyocaulus viviparus TaxID=29172 RepID=A0A0D8XAH3_DICVI|nr:Protein-tyrosine phosphatase [Dictyocaulus viviparus]
MTRKRRSASENRKKEFLRKTNEIDDDALTCGKTENESTKAAQSGTASSDNRSKWSTMIVETKVPIKVLSKEFAKHKSYKPREYTTNAYDKNEPKNRYRYHFTKAYAGFHSSDFRYNDIICIDATRVILKDRPADDDYIHASWMTMPDQYKYICTQGPLTETLNDFWHMMFCERSTVLVQLCDFVEGKHEKCSQYFPKSKGSTESYGPYKVTYMEAKSDPFESVKHIVLKLEAKGHTITVNHFAYLIWPDHTAPFNPASMAGCLKLCRQLAESHPITVHCSAGIGRSATFIAIDYAWQKIRENGDWQMVEAIKDLRKQRFHAIQSPIQYIFLHMCVLEMAAEENLLNRKSKFAPYLEAYTTMLRKYNKKVAAAENRSQM